ncbi:hypothetical protein GCM10010909_01110 [Acidocella aquatica]|uniref:Uncharacterized protein n=1 Tax=Acidocella aquatica TaxID=1922313 RepID=A0ABQ6A5E3_9PROT|nr:hypothetical protein GCM10010909_01110 [Acidocella aquatica]
MVGADETQIEPPMTPKIGSLVGAKAERTVKEATKALVAIGAAIAQRQKSAVL